MSEIVTTSLGRFRRAENIDTGDKFFLFECPACKEWLPMSEEHMKGSRDVSHLKRGVIDRLCEYSIPRNFGASLVAAIQSRILMGEKPYEEDEGA